MPTIDALVNGTTPLAGTERVPIWQAGDAHDVPVTALWPLAVVKPSDETVTSSTTLQDDDHLLVALEANTVYSFDFLVIYTGASTGDLKLGFTVPAGATIYAALFGYPQGGSGSSGASNINHLTASAQSFNFGAAGAASKTLVSGRGVVRTAGTAGNLQLQWAQMTSDATATTVYTDSWLSVQKRV